MIWNELLKKNLSKEERNLPILIVDTYDESIDTHKGLCKVALVSYDGIKAIMIGPIKEGVQYIGDYRIEKTFD